MGFSPNLTCLLDLEWFPTRVDFLIGQGFYVSCYRDIIYLARLSNALKSELLDAELAGAGCRVGSEAQPSGFQVECFGQGTAALATHTVSTQCMESIFPGLEVAS